MSIGGHSGSILGGSRGGSNRLYQREKFVPEWPLQRGL